MSEHKTLSEIQNEIDEYINQFEEGYFHPLSALARLTEEVGELAREMNHRYGDKPKKPDEKENTIENELGDLLFILVCIANTLRIDLGQAYEMVMEKYRVRDAKRWTLKKEHSR